MKKCRICNKTKAFLEFSKDSSRKDGHQNKCKECHSEYAAKHYAKNKDLYQKKHKNYRLRVRQKINQLKHNKPCSDCEMSYPYWIMQFDHQEDKDFSISRGVRSVRLGLILEEIAKCELVCANCHADRTYRKFKEEQLAW